MAHQLRMVVAADGVETQAQAEFLKDIGCERCKDISSGVRCRPSKPNGHSPSVEKDDPEFFWQREDHVLGFAMQFAHRAAT